MRIVLVSIVSFLFLSFAANAAVYPWPLDNGPNGAPPSPTPAELAAQQAALQQQQAAQAEAARLQEEYQRQQQAENGRSEMAMPGMPGSGGGGSGMNPMSSGNSNGIATGGSAGTGANGMANSFINGCTTEPGKFQFKGGTASRGVAPEGCDAKLQASDVLVDFLARNLNRCVQVGTGKNEVINGGKIIHAGTMGDAAHQQTGSLHNFGLALDLNAINVISVSGTRLYNYSNKKDREGQNFFSRFRKCWTEAVLKDKAGCLSNTRSGQVGTIGEEDSRHHNHLHLSVPFCANERPSNAYITMLWLMSVAEAAEVAKEKIDEGPMPPPSTFTRKSVKVKGGELKLTVEDTHGEPVMADHIITVDALCSKKKDPPLAPVKIEACDFNGMTYDAKKNEMTVKYRTSDLVNGRSSCRLPQKKTFKVPCE